MLLTSWPWVLCSDTSPELLATYHTKSTPVLAVKFTSTNVLLAAGVFQGTV